VPSNEAGAELGKDQRPPRLWRRRYDLWVCQCFPSECRRDTYWSLSRGGNVAKARTDARGWLCAIDLCWEPNRITWHWSKIKHGQNCSLRPLRRKNSTWWTRCINGWTGKNDGAPVWYAPEWRSARWEENVVDGTDLSEPDVKIRWIEKGCGETSNAWASVCWNECTVLLLVKLYVKSSSGIEHLASLRIETIVSLEGISKAARSTWLPCKWIDPCSRTMRDVSWSFESKKRSQPDWRARPDQHRPWRYHNRSRVTPVKSTDRDHCYQKIPSRPLEIC
jgi:hypothetical protein